MVSLKSKYGGPMLPEYFIRCRPTDAVAVIEGDDPVLQELTGTGRYYMVELGSGERGSSVAGYFAPPSVRIECSPHLDLRPYRTRKAAEAEAARIRKAQADWLQGKARELTDREEWELRCCMGPPSLFTKKWLAE